MKTESILLVFAFAAITTTNCPAQALTSPGSFMAGPHAIPNAANTNDVFAAGDSASPTGGVTCVAETVTPEIQALARGLESDPVRILNYVHDHIRHVLYFGAKKGAALTLLEKSGNDFDQSALLVALLNAAGYTNT